MNNNNQDLGWPDSMQAPATQAIGDGIIAGITIFVKKNSLKTEIGQKHTNPLGEFVMRFTAEMQDGDADVPYKRIYPFKKSFRSSWQEIIVEISKVMVEMWEKNEQKEAIALARTVSYLETLKFLEDNKDEVIAEYLAIRGGDFNVEELPEGNGYGFEG